MVTTFMLPVWVWNWQHQANKSNYEKLVRSFCLTICLPSGSFSCHLFSMNNIFLCWICRDNRPILFTQTVPFFFWDTVSFLMTATKWKFGLLNYCILMTRPFTFTYQGSFKQCAALASLCCVCLLGCFCEISERFSPLLFHLSVFEHEPAGLHGRNAQRALRTRRITLKGRLNAIPTILCWQNQSSCLGTQFQRSRNLGPN